MAVAALNQATGGGGPCVLSERDVAALADCDKSAMISSEVTTEAQEAAAERAVEPSSMFSAVMTGMPSMSLVLGMRPARSPAASRTQD